MPSNINQSALDDVREQMNKLFKNMFVFTNEDMQLYDACFSNVFSGGITFSYMTATFYAQFAGEILVGMLSSNPFRRFLTTALDEEAKREGRGKYWHESMATKRFGLPGVDYTADMEDLKSMMNTSYMKIESLSNWYGTDERVRPLLPEQQGDPRYQAGHHGVPVPDPSLRLRPAVRRGDHGVRRHRGRPDQRGRRRRKQAISEKGPCIHRPKRI